MCPFFSNIKWQGSWNLRKSGGAKDMNFRENPIFFSNFGYFSAKFFSCSNKEWKVTFKVGIYLSCCISWMMHRRSYKHSDLFPIILKVAKETNEDISRNSEIFKFVACCISNYFIKELDLRRKFHASRRRPVFVSFWVNFIIHL